MGSETFVEVVLAILLPPVGVFLRYGCGVRGVLDLFVVDDFGIYSGNYICPLRVGWDIEVGPSY
ncbi:Proteolipid membrane potential modulator [Macleaya cordata]|uniref:Proteolipid membrane potential modulator n=1 Tax=Macleaya cordata TaxID=56857 RepID=A0A200QHC9_MACCD|nr:Proteolipid membrane potential modulator [Macleaya cordata]